MRSRSQAVFNRLCQVIPGGVNSPVRACKGMGQLPMVVEEGRGDCLIDVDGHTYIDYCCSWGALIHGHAHPVILESVQKRAAKGSTFGITSAIEEQLASEVVHLISSVDQIRFVSSGTEATMSVARLARGFTGKDIIVKFSGNYHGHGDFFLVQAGSGVLGLSPTSSSAGIPEDIVKHTVCLPYNDLEAASVFFRNASVHNHIAAVILEPIAGNMGVVPATFEFLRLLREETQRIGALLIFDEVITGFRVGLQGAQGYYQIQPDLTCFGKIIGGGFPAAAFGGRKEIMSHLAPIGPVYQAGTLSGNPVAMEAGLQALKMVQEPCFYEQLEEKTRFLLNPIQQLITQKQLSIGIQQIGSMFTLFFGKKEVRNLEEAKQVNADQYAHFFRYLFENGIYIPPSPHEAWFISSAHTKDNLKITQTVILDFLNQIS
jgi:glutamate-1-semialdehyde 2,1-aminomutase